MKAFDYMNKPLMAGVLILILAGGINLLPNANSSSSNTNVILFDNGFTSPTISNNIGTFTIDKNEYDTPFTNGEYVNIHGIVNHPHDAGKIHILITLPDTTITGSTIFTTANNGDFEYHYQLDANSQKGTYHVLATYDEDVMGTLDFTVKQVLLKQTPITNTNIVPHSQTNVKTLTNYTTPAFKAKTINYVDTRLSLDYKESVNKGYVNVYTKLNTNSGNLLSNVVSILVDRQYKTYVSTDTWSSDIWVGFGSHTIEARYSETNDLKNSSTIYKNSDITKTIFIQQPTSNPQTTEQPQTSSYQINQENNPEPQMKIDLSGNSLLVVTIGMIVTVVIARIIIYFVRKSKKSGGNQTEPISSFGYGDASRIIKFKGKTVYVEITAQYPDRKPSSSSWNYGTDRKIGSGSGGGYMLTISLKKKDKSLMTEIVNVIEKYDFNSLLVNFQIHKSFKSSQDISIGTARQLLYDICRDLETEVEPKNKSTKSPRNVRVDKPTNEGPIHEPHSTEPRNPDPVNDSYDRTGTRNSSPVPESYISTEPPKVQPKHGKDYIFTGAPPISGSKEKPPRQEEPPRQEPTHVIQTEFNAYRILGLSKNATCEEVKAKYKELMSKKENKLHNILNMSEEEVKRITKIQSDINKARDQIMNEKNCGK